MIRAKIKELLEMEKETRFQRYFGSRFLWDIMTGFGQSDVEREIEREALT